MYAYYGHNQPYVVHLSCGSALLSFFLGLYLFTKTIVSVFVPMSISDESTSPSMSWYSVFRSNLEYALNVIYLSNQTLFLSEKIVHEYSIQFTCSIYNTHKFWYFFLFFLRFFFVKQKGERCCCCYWALLLSYISGVYIYFMSVHNIVNNRRSNVYTQ